MSGSRSCRRCGRPIPAARLHAMPEALLCIGCAEEESNPRREPPVRLPSLPASLRTCPRCGQRGVVRQNRAEGTWFAGCSNYPRCQWSHSLP